MDVRNCRKCGRLFNYAMGPIVCQNCRESMEEKFQEVKKYVYEQQNRLNSGCVRNACSFRRILRCC